MVASQPCSLKTLCARVGVLYRDGTSQEFYRRHFRLDSVWNFSASRHLLPLKMIYPSNLGDLIPYVTFGPNMESSQLWIPHTSPLPTLPVTTELNNWGRKNRDTSRLSALSWTDDLLGVFYCLSPMTGIRNKQRLTGDWWKNSQTPLCPHLLRLSLKCQLKTFPLPWGWHISATRLQTARDKRRAGAPPMTIKWCNLMLQS